MACALFLHQKSERVGKQADQSMEQVTREEGKERTRMVGGTACASRSKIAPGPSSWVTVCQMLIA